MRDFSLPMLERLLTALQGAGFRFVRFDAYYQDREPYDTTEKVILFRHDVDRFPRTAVATAALEARLGLAGTYYVRMKPWTFKPEVLKAIAGLGHEIGYHYECLADTDGDYDRAAQLCRENLERFRAVVPVSTASMHSRPLSKWDNRLLWNEHPLDSFGLIGETYRSIDHRRYLYLADSGRNWNANRNVVWDTVDGAVPPPMKPGTEGLIEAVAGGVFGSIHLLIHPNRWPGGSLAWVSQTVQDAAINSLKTVVKRCLRRGRAATATHSRG